MRKWDQTLYLGPGFPLPPCPRYLWRRLVQAAQPRRLVPKHLSVPLPPQPRTGAPPATRKGSTKEQQCFSQAASGNFLHHSPPTTSALLLFLPQTRHPATGLGALGGWEGSQQPSCGLRSARCGDLLGSFKTDKKTLP